MKTRIIHTKLWTDSYSRSLATNEKLFYFYLISNEFINVLHLYELPNDVASFQTKIPIAEIEQIKNKFKADNKIDFRGEWIHLINADKYAYYKGIKNNHLKLRLIIEMGDDIFTYFQVKLEQIIKEIINETDLNKVEDREFLTLLNRVIHRGIDKGMGLLPVRPPDRGIDTDIDTAKKPETKKQKPEVENQNPEQAYQKFVEERKRLRL